MLNECNFKRGKVKNNGLVSNKKDEVKTKDEINKNDSENVYEKNKAEFLLYRILCKYFSYD